MCSWCGAESRTRSFSKLRQKGIIRLSSMPSVEFVKPQSQRDMAAGEEPSSAGRLDADQRNAGISVSDCSYPDAGD
jgi:hypothetical protein